MSAVLEDAPACAIAPRVLELRQYTLHAGQRDTLVELFEREFVETQEALGMHVPGIFRDIDRPDRFVWLRGFADMASRRKALAAFYGGPAWQAHRDAANATMIDSDDVLLLRPIGRFTPPPRVERGAGVVIATIYPLRRDGVQDFADFFERAIEPLLWNASIGLVARFATDASPNDFPALPVRQDDTVFAWLSRHDDLARAGQAMARFDEAMDWSTAISDELAAHLAAPAQTLRLAPTARSRLR